MSTLTCLHVCSFEGCNKTFSRPNRLVIHLRTHTGERPYLCECGKSYARSSHLTRHKETAHGSVVTQTLLCEEEGCNQTFSSKQNLNKHIKRKHEKILYKCLHERCGRSFHKHQQLAIHEYEHTNIKPFKCAIKGCEKSFLLPSKLKQHMKVHAGYPCDHEDCSEIFDNWTKLRQHKMLVHPTVHTCSHCDKTFTLKNGLQQHMKSHLEEREVFACPRPNCGRTYLEQRNLTAHIKSYHDGQRFQCEFEGCERSFATKQKCQKHFQLHQLKGTLPRKKSKKASKKKSLLEDITGLDSKLVKCESMEDLIHISDSERGLQEVESQMEAGKFPPSLHVEYLTESHFGVTETGATESFMEKNDSNKKIFYEKQRNSFEVKQLVKHNNNFEKTDGLETIFSFEETCNKDVDIPKMSQDSSEKQGLVEEVMDSEMSVEKVLQNICPNDSGIICDEPH